MNGPIAGVPFGSQIAWGTVGWVDRDTWYDQGDGSDGATGKTLVCVTLFGGRTPDTEPDQTQAQGTPILCQIGGGLFRIPPKGTQVLVAIPAPHGLTPGSPVIIATSEPSPAIQFSKDRVVMDYGDQTVVIRAACVVIESTASPNPQYVAVGSPPSGGPAGIMLMDETGSGIAIQSGVVGIMSTDNGSPPDAKLLVQVTKSGVDIMNKNGPGSQFQMDAAGNITILGTAFNSLTAGGILGANAAAGAFAVTTVAGAPSPSAHWLLGV